MIVASRHDYRFKQWFFEGVRPPAGRTLPGHINRRGGR
jgi:hypothetical protein